VADMRPTARILSALAALAITACSTATTMSEPTSTATVQPLRTSSALTTAAPSMGRQPSPPTSVRPSVTPGSAERFPAQTAEKFKHPFTYAVDPSAGLGFAPCCPPNDDVYQFRIPEGSTGEWSLPIVVVENTGGLRTDFCHDGGGGVNTSASPQEFVDFMSAVPGLLVAPLPDLVIDGRPAKGVDVSLGAIPSSCGNLWVFNTGNAYNCCFPEGGTRRTYALEVDGDLVLITAPFQPATKDRNLALAASFIDSMRFVAAAPSPSASGS
jgi:hypothetical protein